MIRFYHNTFEDSFRQECVDLLVGEHRLSGEVWASRSCEGTERHKKPQSAEQMAREFLPPRPSSLALKSQAARQLNPDLSTAQPDVAAPAALSSHDACSSSSSSSSSISSRSSRETKGAPTVPLRIWIGTWNVAGRDIHEWDNLEDWLTPVNEQADIFVFCVQELVRSSNRATAAVVTPAFGAASVTVVPAACS